MQLVPKTASPLPPSQGIASSAPTTETIILDVGGMKCAGCVKVVEQQLTHHPGVISACVNLVTEVAVVESEAGAVDPVALAEKLTAAGFATQPRYPQGEAGEMPSSSNPESRSRERIAVFVAVDRGWGAAPPVGSGACE